MSHINQLLAIIMTAAKYPFKQSGGDSFLSARGKVSTDNRMVFDAFCLVIKQITPKLPISMSQTWQKQIHFIVIKPKHTSNIYAISIWSFDPGPFSSVQGVYRWGVGWMMRRRTCHGPSRSSGEHPLGTSNTKTEPRRLQLDRPLPPSLLQCPRRKDTTTTTTALALTCCPVPCTGSLAYPSTVRGGEASGNTSVVTNYLLFYLVDN